MYIEHGLIRAAAVTPKLNLGSPKKNAKNALDALKKLYDAGVRVAVFPEMFICGYTAMDLFFSKKLIDESVAAIKNIRDNMPSGMITFVGAPITLDGRLYNCAVALTRGKALGITPKTELPEHDEFYEKRYFTPAFNGTEYFAPLDAPIGKILYRCENYPLLTVGCEICEDMWVDVPPSVEMTRAGATLIVNLSASDEIVGKAEYRRQLVCGVSGRQHCVYVYCDAGDGESTTDVVFSAHNIIAENGVITAESLPFGEGLAAATVDLEKIDVERRKVGVKPASQKFEYVSFTLDDVTKEKFTPPAVSPYPFVPSDPSRAELILKMQSRALKQRFEAVGAKKAVIGVSGGLDSSLALLVCVRALGKDMILPVTMPAFGTTSTTKSNAVSLCRALGLDVKTVDIKNTVNCHLKDIDHADKDVVYENAQARVRTLTLFDLANKVNGLVVGTGDLSELALGWATYNGDHMSSYGVNAGVPKTLVRCLVGFEAARLGGEAGRTLEKVLATPVSPELLPPENGEIAQKTEDILGAYDLHDFIIYYHVRYGFTRDKIELLMSYAFPSVAAAERKKALDVFYKRFRISQFKRSCLPDGVKIGSVSFSPRSDFRMPSDLGEL